MNQGQYIFSQITDFLPIRVFDRFVNQYDGNKYVRFFTCWNQLLSMLFGQLSGRESLRDLMIGLEALKSKALSPYSMCHNTNAAHIRFCNFTNAFYKRDT